ncbi:MAG: hypothetical protein GXP31_07145 [Kiritimatiellaeota bacterium]|nr:hypothetical protein [Kiritimatiellota bacterium]
MIEKRKEVIRVDKVGAILDGVATLIVGVGVLVVLLKTGGLVAALGGRLNPENKEENATSQS